MGSREKEFEVFAKQYGLLLDRVVSNDRYESMETEYAFAAWVASHKVSLDAAAGVAEFWGRKGTPEGFCIADMIRALKADHE